jgi:hypothetical protein
MKGTKREEHEARRGSSQTALPSRSSCFVLFAGLRTFVIQTPRPPKPSYFNSHQKAFGPQKREGDEEHEARRSPLQTALLSRSSCFVFFAYLRVFVIQTFHPPKPSYFNSHQKAFGPLKRVGAKEHDPRRGSLQTALPSRSSRFVFFVLRVLRVPSYLRDPNTSLQCRFQGLRRTVVRRMPHVSSFQVQPQWLRLTLRLLAATLRSTTWSLPFDLLLARQKDAPGPPAACLLHRVKWLGRSRHPPEQVHPAQDSRARKEPDRFAVVNYRPHVYHPCAGGVYHPCAGDVYHFTSFESAIPK